MDSACCLPILYNNPKEAAATTAQGYLIIKYHLKEKRIIVHLKRQNCNNTLLIYVCL